MKNQYLARLSAEARETLAAMRTYRAAGNVQMTAAWAQYWANVKAEDLMVRSMSNREFALYITTWLLLEKHAAAQLVQLSFAL